MAILKTKIILRNDIYDLWEQSSLILSKGEPAIEYDPAVKGDLPVEEQSAALYGPSDYSIKLKIGDGVSTYNELPYVADSTLEARLTSLINSNANNAESALASLQSALIGTDEDAATTNTIKGLRKAINVSKSLIDTLIGEDVSKSVRQIANEEVAAQLIDGNASEALDTLQELAQWFQDHPTEASEFNERITALESKTELGLNGESQEYDTVKDYVEARSQSLLDEIDSIKESVGLTETSSGSSLVDRIESLESFATANTVVEGEDPDPTSLLGRVIIVESYKPMLEELEACYDDESKTLMLNGGDAEIE